MLLGTLSHVFFGTTIFLTSLFLVLLVLVQRGRGGGIAGALGGAGGQSAFGTKAGDLFTRITVAVASAWILLCCMAIYFLRTPTFETGVVKDDTVITNPGDAPLTSGITTDAATSGSTGAATASETTTPAASSATSATESTAAPATEPAAPAAEAAAAPSSENTAPAANETPAADAPATENPAAGN